MKKNIDYCYAVYNAKTDKFEFSDKESNDCFKLKTLTRKERKELGESIKNDDLDKFENMFDKVVDDTKASIKKDQFETMDIIFLFNGLLEFCTLSKEDVLNFR